MVFLNCLSFVWDRKGLALWLEFLTKFLQRCRNQKQEVYVNCFNAISYGSKILHHFCNLLGLLKFYYTQRNGYCSSSYKNYLQSRFIFQLTQIISEDLLKIVTRNSFYTRQALRIWNVDLFIIWASNNNINIVCNPTIEISKHAWTEKVESFTALSITKV